MHFIFDKSKLNIFPNQGKMQVCITAIKDKKQGGYGESTGISFKNELELDWRKNKRKICMQMEHQAFLLWGKHHILGKGKRKRVGWPKMPLLAHKLSLFYYNPQSYNICQHSGALNTNVNPCKGWDKSITLEIVGCLRIFGLSEKCPWMLKFPKISFLKLEVSGNFTPPHKCCCQWWWESTKHSPFASRAGDKFLTRVAMISGWIWNFTATALWLASFLSLF